MFFRKRKKKKGLFAPKSYNVLDIGLIKLAVLAFAFFFVSYVPQAAVPELRWFWLVVFILAAIRPILKAFNS